MKWVETILVLAVAFLALCWESGFSGMRRMLGAQIDLLPALMVFAALRGSFVTVGSLALAGGLWFDSLSANRLGVSVLPLLTVGTLTYMRRDLILRGQVFAQSVLGAAASVAVPALTILTLLTLRQTPLLGWGTLWQFLVMGAAGALAAPAFFLLFEWIDRTFMYSSAAQSSFRPDREIRRGR